MPKTNYDFKMKMNKTILDYTKIGDVKEVYFLTEQYTTRTNGYENKIYDVLHSTLVNRQFDSMNLNITIWFSSGELLEGLDKMENDYSGCFTDEINTMKDMVNEYYDSEWVIEYGF